MTLRVPRSVLLAVRDRALVAVAGAGLGLPAADAALRQYLVAFAGEHGYEMPAPSWGDVAGPVREWLATVLVWALVCWCASRARAGRRTVWLPGALAVVAVAARTGTALLGLAAQQGAAQPRWARSTWSADWPGAADPAFLHRDGAATYLAAAWVFPPLVAALLLAATWLGGRAGRAPDDPASRAVRPVGRAGLAVAAVVVGLPALGAAVGAVVAHRSTSRAAWAQPGDPLVGTLHDLVLPLAVALTAAALLSGTGLLGALATIVAAAQAVAVSLEVWLRGWASDGALAQAAAVAGACLAVALWRPAAVWGGELLEQVAVPAVPRDTPDGPER